MSSKYWLLFGSLALGAAHTAACSSEFKTCEAKRTCPAGGASGTAGTAEAGEGGAGAAADEGGKGGRDARGNEAGAAGDTEIGAIAGSGGMAGESSVATELEIAQPSLDAGKTYVPFSGQITASGAAHYTWSITSGSLPAGLALQGTQSATVTIAGTPAEAGEFPISLSVTDGASTKTVDVTLVVTHSALFLSDRRLAGVNELFLTDIGAGSAGAPVQLSASLPAGGGVSSYAWSPDGSKVLYLAKQSSGGAEELWLALLASPGTAQRVSAAGIGVRQLSWLGSGNIAAYSTSTADGYLVDLSGSTPGASKLAVTGTTIIATGALVSGLLPSPNGTSIAFPYLAPMVGGAYAYAYATWAAGVPKMSLWNGGGSEFAGYSHDGRFVAFSASGIGTWLDLSATSPAENSTGPGFSGAWSPNSELLLYYGDGTSSADPGNLKLGNFNKGTLASTPLLPPKACDWITVEPWSPDGKNVLFDCSRDLRGISNVEKATVGMDFSLLPSAGFLSSAVDVMDRRWSPDSRWIGMRADRDVGGQMDLYLIRWSAPGAVHRPHVNSMATGVTNYAFAPNSQSIAFVGTIAPQSNSGLYLTKLPASGAPPIATLVSAPVSAVVQTDINWLPGSRVLAYRATVSGNSQLFALPVEADGTAGNAVPISRASGSGVSSYQLSPVR
ncbi:MAG TPA: putative Ig domain-containing protein [Polyangiaceae bacterium]|nr:putative Ig domain-containing protein [Polyangiaceae bacterium]